MHEQRGGKAREPRVSDPARRTTIYYTHTLYTVHGVASFQCRLASLHRFHLRALSLYFRFRARARNTSPVEILRAREREGGGEEWIRRWERAQSLRGAREAYWRNLSFYANS